MTKNLEIKKYKNKTKRKWLEIRKKKQILAKGQRMMTKNL